MTKAGEAKAAKAKADELAKAEPTKCKASAKHRAPAQPDAKDAKAAKQSHERSPATRETPPPRRGSRLRARSSVVDAPLQ